MMMQRKKMLQGGLGSVAVVGAATLIGCATQPPPTLPSSAFTTHRPLGEYGAEKPVDRTGPQYEDRNEPAPLAPQRQAVSSAVQNAMPAPTMPPTLPTQPAVAEGTSVTRPSTGPGSGISTSQYQIVGTVVTNVNGKPIFADKILSRIEPALAAAARLSPSVEAFQIQAAKEAHDELANEINDELEFAAAERSLPKADQDLAARITAEWVNVQVRQAGGSEAVARQKWAQQGVNFEEIKRQQYRENLVRIYYTKRIYPLIHVTADDMRRYYEQNIRQYAVAAAVKFRVIKIDATTRSHAQAVELANSIFGSARHGADFAELAAKDNDDPILKSTRGAVGIDGWMEKGAYAQEDVEREVWKLKPGQVTDPIDQGNAIYIAKLEDIRTGKAQPFDDIDLQDKIYDLLRRQQFNELRQQYLRNLMSKSVINPDPPDMAPLMDMIMQKYPHWIRQPS